MPIHKKSRKKNSGLRPQTSGHALSNSQLISSLERQMNDIANKIALLQKEASGDGPETGNLPSRSASRPCETWKSHRNPKCVFTRPNGQPISENSLASAITITREQCGFGCEFTSHVLRHSFVTRLLSKMRERPRANDWRNRANIHSAFAHSPRHVRLARGQPQDNG